MQYSVKFVKKFIVKQFKNSTHKILILSRIEKMVLVVLFCVAWLDFLKSHFKGPKYTISKSSFAQKSQMWWYESGNSGGCQKRKKLICGTEGEILVAHGQMPKSLTFTFIFFNSDLYVFYYINLKLFRHLFILQ